MAKRVMIVDDSSLIRSVAQKAASGAGYDVVSATNGQEGLQQLESERVDLVFCDINMPVMDGLSMVERVKADPRYEFLPIVMLTTENNPELKARGKALGVKAWLLKPFNKDKFLMALEKLLG